ncbi:hypothetical protein [Chengkuizengella sediminis]|uniref:hypothetical protein n=1 Tax=Chengkuizengella sediminis TaxID=1885917 RepID=UPI001389512F|nr:hypothetical protein [Chengkuizengella sediminis]NDI33606.1 hypothetical protein [Chengkuizengella sediminis]
MGVFDKSICDCCVCPMQCVLEQLVGVEGLEIDTPVNNIPTTISGVNDFIVSTTDGDIPVCQITHVEIMNPTDTIITTALSALKPIRKNSKGECACCEDPMTNLLKFEIGNTFEVEFIGPDVPFTNEILGVGEGILVGVENGISLFFDIYSTCTITRVIPITQQQINDPSRLSRRTTLPPVT